MSVWLVRAGRYGERENLALDQGHNAASPEIQIDLALKRIWVRVPGAEGVES